MTSFVLGPAGVVVLEMLLPVLYGLSLSACLGILSQVIPMEVLSLSQRPQARKVGQRKEQWRGGGGQTTSQDLKCQREEFRCVLENISRVPNPDEDGHFLFRVPEPSLFKNY